MDADQKNTPKVAPTAAHKSRSRCLTTDPYRHTA